MSLLVVVALSLYVRYLFHALEGDQANATGDNYGTTTIKIWSIEKYLKDGEN